MLQQDKATNELLQALKSDYSLKTIEIGAMQQAHS